MFLLKQIGTSGADGVGFCVDGVSERQGMVQALYPARSIWQPPAFRQGRLRAGVTCGRAELLICVRQPRAARRMEPRGVEPGVLES